MGSATSNICRRHRFFDVRQRHFMEDCTQTSVQQEILCADEELERRCAGSGVVLGRGGRISEKDI